MLKVRPQFYDLADAKVNKLSNSDVLVIVHELDTITDSFDRSESFNSNSLIYLYRMLHSQSFEAGYFASYFHRLPLAWRLDVSVEDIEQFDRYQVLLNRLDCDLLCCMGYLEQLRFDGVADNPELIKDRITGCHALLSSGTGRHVSTYHLTLFDMIYKWILRKLLIEEPLRYGVNCLENLGSLFIDYKTKWHNIFCFRDFLKNNLPDDGYRLLLSDGLKYYAEHSGCFDPCFLVGGALAQKVDFYEPYLWTPDSKKRIILSGKEFESYLDVVSHQPGFYLYKDDMFHTLSSLTDVTFRLRKSYKFPIVTHLNWR